MPLKDLILKIKQDMHVNLHNSHNYKIALLLIIFRISSFFAQSNYRLVCIIGMPVRIFYRVISEFLYGIELGDKMDCGGGLRIDHGFSLVVNRDVIIGSFVTLKNSTTIGNRLYRDGSLGGSPVIEDHVLIGPNTVIFGEITVGEGSIIGAGSCVNKDIPKSSIAYGNPVQVKPK